MIANPARPATLAALLATILVAGCSTHGHDSVTTGAIPDDYRKRHPIVLSQTEQTLDLAIASTAHDLDLATRSNIQAFAGAFAGSGSGVVHILEPAGSKNASAVIGLRDQIIDAVMAGGVPRHKIGIQTYDASAHGPVAPLRLSYQAVDATVGDCGNWLEDLTSTPDNRNYHDFGCSTQKNLAQIIENPNDLMGPRASTPIDAAQRANVLSTWQEGSTPIESEVDYDF